MCRKLICLGTLLSLLIGIPYARGDISDELMGYWNFDEGTISGTSVADSSGKENHGISVGNLTPVQGKVGTGALAFGASKYITIDSVANDIQGADDITLNGWVKTATTTRTYWIACNTATGGNVVMFAIDGPMGGISYIYDGGTSTREIHSLNPVNDNQWHMLTYVKSGSVGTQYVDGVEQGTHTVSYAPFSSDDLWSMGQEWDTASPSNFFSDAGQLDEVAIWRRALTMAEIVEIYNAGNGISLLHRPAASSPNPAVESMDVPRDVTLSWEPGMYADKHDVYLGTSFDDVNDATGGVAQDANSYTPAQRLDFGTTYYWRVDEVNAPPTSHIAFKGNVWSFTTEPVGYPIAGENITATASGSEAYKGPENTINGSGLDDNDLHSMDATDMWLSGSEPNAWIEYELDKVYKLHEMWVWNSNDSLESVIGFGFKDVTIEHSVNGTDYTTLGTTHEFARAPGAFDYAHNTTVDFGGVTAKYVRLTANNNWGGILDQSGLSEVRFFSIPVYAREPSPDSDTTDVAVDVTLGFRAGREAAEHNVYLSTDEQAVIDGNAPVTTVTEASYSPLSLDLDTTYYWKINEVNEAETTTTWQGDIWNFTTHEFFVVDGFEDYNDYPPNEIWSTWVDGYGVSANGATVGYPNPDWNQDEHYVETTIVNGSEQAMPFFYSNTGGATYSEGERTFAVPQDWTKAGIQTLALYFRGTAGNTGQMFVKINGSKIPYDGAAGNIAIPGWQLWNIDLTSSGLNLQSVSSLAIGIDGNGAIGTLYFDDIGLYALAPAPPNEWRIADEDDDVEEMVATGSISMTSSDLELAYEDPGQVDPQIIGVRFTGIPIPKGATITEAWVRFQVDETKGGTQAVNLIIEGELSLDATGFTSDAFNVSSRPTTTTQVQWAVPNWTTVGDQGPDQTTPSIASIIQEIVNQNGWAGGSIVLMFRDNPGNPSLGIRCAEAGPGSDAALLHISYQ